MASNVALLTQSHKVVKSKKRQKLGQASAVVFDEDARRCAFITGPFHYLAGCMTRYPREFLTGFHKRKLAKKEEGKKRAQAREKEERLEARREVHILGANILNLLTCLRFSNGVCLRSRPPRTPQKSKRRTAAWHNVRPIPVFLPSFFSSFFGIGSLSGS